MKPWRWGALASVGVLALAWAFAGCAGREYAPKRGVMYYHSELPAADRAVEAARAAGKDKECPADFKATEKMRDDAYDLYLACRTAEGIAKANEAAARAKGLCPRKAEPPPPPPPPPPPMPPTTSLSASPPSVDQGKCAMLTWSSQNVTEASIEPGIGSVSPSGSREVCPASTTQYTVTATGPGGSRTATTTVTVNPPPPPPAAPKVIDRLVLHINFDTNKSVIRAKDVPDLEKAVAFVKKYPDAKISVVGYTDSRGSDKYNLALSERRAQAVKKYLEDKGGVSAGRITAEGKGKADPIGDNNTENGRFENRRVELLVLER